MKLSDTFSEAIHHAEALVSLYRGLVTRNQRAVRPGWAARFFRARLVTWPKREGIWRSRNDTLLILGRCSNQWSHHTFSAESLAVFLRGALVFAMAAIDKVIHEAVSRRFTTLVRAGGLDDLVKVDVSKVYRIARESQVRKGPGGRIRTRAGNKIKTEVLDRLYRESFLSPARLQQICAACGKKGIFGRYGHSLRPRRGAESVRALWVAAYQRRNQMAHECDIVRKSRARKVHFHRIRPGDVMEDVAFVKDFGKFLAKELE